MTTDPRVAGFVPDVSGPGGTFQVRYANGRQEIVTRSGRVIDSFPADAEDAALIAAQDYATLEDVPQ